ncbi:MAG: RHS repeat protein [Clostridiales bacterium]|nr:RHS repeat protein [Clostridiales bacterium]
MKTVSIICAATMLTQMIPMTASANSKSQNLTPSAEAVVSNVNQRTDPAILAEDVSKRTENTKYFICADGSLLAAKYPEPVHYKDASGKWVDYDNTLNAVKAEPSAESAEDDTQSSSAASSASQESSGTSSVVSRPDGNSSAASEEGSGVSFAASQSEGKSSGVSSESSAVSSPNSQSGTESNASSQSLRNRTGSSSVSSRSADQKKAVTASNAAEDAQEYANKKSDQKVRIAKRAKENRMFTVRGAGGELSWGYKNTNKSKLEITQKKQPTDNKNKFLNLTKVNQEGWYRGIYDNVDLQVIVSSIGVKENLILNNANAKRTFDLSYKTDGLTPVQADDHTIRLTDKSGKTVYTLCAPVMTDNAGAVSNAITIKLQKAKNKKFTVELAADNGWLDSPERQYPVTLDPLVLTKQVPSSIDDATIIRSGRDKPYPYGSLMVGKETSTYGIVRSVVKTNLPSLGNGDMVVSAEMNLQQTRYSGNVGTQVDIGRITSNWDSTSLSQNGYTVCPSFDTTIADYAVANSSTISSNGSMTTWDITRIVKDWYNGSPNYGVCLWSNNESNAAYATYASAQNIFLLPTISIYYVNNNGLEDYWTYHSQDVGTNGKAYVNDYTGNLAITEDVFSSTGSRMPNSIQLTYNSRNCGTQTAHSNLGYGFQFDFNQRVDSVSSSLQALGYKYKYTDEDGTEHYFRQKDGSTTEWVDEDGLDLTLTENSGIYIRDKSGYERHFYTPASGGTLYHEKDSNGNKIQYNKTNGLITSMTDGAGRTTTVTYSNVTNSSTGQTVNHPTLITGPDGTTVQLKYEDGNKNLLTKIVYADGSYTEYWYDASGRIAKIRSSNNRRTEYSYAGGRVTKISEYSSTSSDGSDLGDSLSATYNKDNTTTFADNHGVTELYQFDNAGRTTSIRHDDGSISNAAYEDNGKGNQGSTSLPSSGKNNKQKASAGTDKFVKNYVLNPSAERDSSFYGVNGGQKSYDSSTALVDGEKVQFLGSRSLKVVSTAAGSYNGYAQIIAASALKGQSYTASAYIKTSGVTGSSSGSGALIMADYYSGDTYLSGSVKSTPVTGSQKWQRVSFTDQMPTNADSMRIRCYLLNCTGTAWFDCLQLEAGSTMSNCNLLEDSDLKRGDIWGSGGFESNDVKPGSGTVTIHGTAGGNKYLYQYVAVNKADVCFNMFGTVQAASAKIKGGRCFALEMAVKYADGQTEYHTQQFNYTTTAPQSMNYNIRPKRSGVVVSRVGFFFLYRQNANTCRVSNAMLTFDETGTTYTYDDKGNLVSANDNAKNNQAYSFNSANELATSANEKGETYQYIYENETKSGGNSHRLAAARSNQRGNGFVYTYDAYGNVTGVKMGAVNNGTTNKGTIDPSKAYLSGSTAYNSTGNYAVSATDARGKTTNYGITDSNGLTNWQDTPATVYGSSNSSVRTNYTYNPQNYNLLSVSSTGSSGTVTNSYAYNDAKQQLTSIAHNGFRYGFTYDAWGRSTAANIQNASGTVKRTLATSSYLRAGSGSPVSKVTYGNGDYVQFGYDKYDRETSKRAETGALSTSTYNAKGQLARLNDLAAGITYHYSYDLLGRLINTRSSGANSDSSHYAYDNMNRMVGNSTTVNGYVIGNTCSYGSDSLVTKAWQGSYYTDYVYDNLNRVTGATMKNSGDTRTGQQVRYSYAAGANGSSTALVSGVEYLRGGVSDGSITYTYDNGGNIRTITESGKTVTYSYDGLNQLVREDNQRDNKSCTYSYNAGGNITAKSEYAYTTGALGTPNSTISYGYGDADWKDLMTSCNGRSITYDAIGNPLTYRDGMTMTWQRGRQLASLQKGSTAVNYGYGEDGLRTKKTVAGL